MSSNSSLEAVKERLAVLKAISHVPYDGVHGEPGNSEGTGEPAKWIPEWALKQFHTYRKRLLEIRGYQHAELLTLINKYSFHYLGSDGPQGFLAIPERYPSGDIVDPYCFEDEIGFLAWLKWCVDDGDQVGLSRLAGGFAVSGRKQKKGQSAGGKARSEGYLDENRMIERYMLEILDAEKSNKPSKMQLARRVVKRINPKMSSLEVEKKANSITRRSVFKENY